MSKRDFTLKEKFSALMQAGFYSVLLSNGTFIQYAQAAPTDGKVVGGTGSISQSGAITTINQNTDRMAINWQGFDIAIDERVQVNQNAVSDILLNNVLSNSASQIQGRIDALGQVIIVNPNGVIFSSTSSINVGGLIASGLRIEPTDFMNGNYIFNEVVGTDGTVINSGVINASLGGSVTLLGKQVKNDGLISARLGMVNVAAGKQAVVTFDNRGLFGIRVTKEILQSELGIDPAVLNSGEINAEGGKILLTGSVSQDIFSQAVNTGDMQQATSVVVDAEGNLMLGAGADVVNSGVINVSSTEGDAGEVVLLGENVTSSGAIHADALNGQAGKIELHANDIAELTAQSQTTARAVVAGTGGDIKLLGNKVGIFDQSLVDASGANGGGDVLIGGDRQGLNKQVRNADFIYLAENTNVIADATDNGKGGKVIAFASDTARIHGGLYARGGMNGGDGGFIETSGLKGFRITHAPDVSANAGVGGTWLIDPNNIRIINDPVTPNPSLSTNINTDASPFESTDDGAIIEVGFIESALLNGDVVINTTESGTNGDLGNISFEADLALGSISGNSVRTRSLSLNAHNDIIFSNTSSITRDAASNDRLNINLNADSDASGFGSITMANDASGINTFGGDFTVTNAVNFNSATASINVGSGDIDLDGVNGDVVLGNLAATNGISSDLYIRNANSITQQNATTIFIARNSYLDATNNITLNGASNNFESVSLNALAAEINDVDAIKLDASAITNTLAITAGSISDIGDVSAATVNLDATGDITLDNNNNFTTVNITAANSASIKDVTGGVAISANNGPNTGGVVGTLDVVSTNGSITNSGEVNAGGTATFTVNDGSSVILDTANNTFGSTVNFSSAGTINNITVTDDTALALGTINIDGSLNATGDSVQLGGTDVGAALNINTTNALNAGHITQVDRVVATGTTTLNATGNVDLANTNNNFSTVATATAQNLTLVDSSSIELGKTTVINDLAVTSGDGNNFTITQVDDGNLSNDGLTIGGSSTFLTLDTNTSNSGNNVILTNSDNALTGYVSITADRAEITTAGALELGAINLNGASSQTSIFIANGNITQSLGASIINDASSNVTRLEAAGNNITLLNDGNDFSRVMVNAHDVKINENDHINFGASTVTGSLDVVANNNGNISQYQAIDVTGLVTLTATGDDIVLDNNSNNLASVNIVSASLVTLVDSTDAIAIQGSVTGDLNVTANGSSATNVITNTGATSADALTVIGGAAFTVSNNQSIDLSNSANTFNTDPTFNLTVTDTINNLKVTDTTAIAMQNGLTTGGDLSVVGTSVRLNDTTVGANLDLLATDAVNGVIDQNSGNVNITGTSTLNAKTIDFTNAGNNFQGAVLVNNTTADVSLRDDTGGIRLGNALNAFVSSTLNVVSNGGNISQGNAITTGASIFEANNSHDILLENTLNNFGGTIEISAANDASITDSTVLNINGAVVDNDLTLVSTTAGVVLDGTISVGNNMVVTAAGAITDAVTNNTINVTGVTTHTADSAGIAQDITLDSTNGNYADINVIRAKDVTLVDNVDSVGIMGNVVGFLNLTANDTGSVNAITNPDELNVAGTATFNVATGQSINLANAANTFDAGVVFNPMTSINNLHVTDTTALQLQNGLSINGDLTVTASQLEFQNTTVGADGAGNLNVTTSNGITQVGATALDINGVSTLDGGIGGIYLAENNNDFKGDVSLTTTSLDTLNNPSDVVIKDANNIKFSASSIQGDLTVAAQSVSQVNDITPGTGDGISVTNSASFEVADNNDVVLDNIDNNFNGISISSTGTLNNVVISNTSALDLQAMTVNTNLRAISLSNITNSGVLAVGGLATFNGNNISLDNMANNFTDITIEEGSAVSIRNQNTLNFAGDSSITNNMAVVVDAGDITNDAAAAITVTNNAAFTANNGSIVLDSGNHNFGSVQLNSSSHATVSEVNGIDIRASSVGGNLTLIADSGDIGSDDIVNNSGSVVVMGTSTFNTSSTGGRVLLNRAGSNHQLNGAITAEGHGATQLTDVQIINRTNTQLQTINTTDLTLTSSGAITDLGVITVANSTVLSSLSDIALNSAANDNDFNTVTITSANNASIGDINALDLGAVSITGVLTTNSNGLATSGDTIANGGINLDAGTGGIAINNSLSSNAGSLALVAAQDIDQAPGMLLTGNNVAITSVNGDFNQSGSIVSSAGSVSVTAGQAINMLSGATTSSTADITYSANGNIGIQALSAANGTVSLQTSGAIVDNNNTGNNLTANKVAIRSATGIGSGNAIETRTAELDVINTTGRVEIDNSSAVKLTNLVNSGDIIFNNSGNVTVDHVDAGFTVGLFEANVTNGSIIGIDRSPEHYSSKPDITADRALITTDGDFGSIERPIVLRIRSEFYLDSIVGAPFYYGARPPIVRDLSQIQYDFFDTISNLTGQQLIEVESLAEIDPAVFSEVHNYNVDENSIRLPRDQLYEDELDKYYP